MACGGNCTCKTKTTQIDPELLRDITESSMHIVDGFSKTASVQLDQEKYNNVMQNLCMGRDGVFSSLAEFALPCAEMLQAGYKKHEECLGVFHYDVSFEFGKWFGAYVMEKQIIPNSDLCLSTLADINDEFWQTNTTLR